MTEARPGPLSGFRVLELTTTVSGPMCGMTLADQGAEVIKVEPPMTGDTARYLGPERGGFTSLFSTLNRNKKSVALDLKDAEQQAIFLKLVESADVILENYRPGVLDRLGIGYEALSKINPQIVYASITGYADGPYENRRVFDPLIQATSGTAWAQGEGDPENIKTIIFDKVTALTTAQGITAALLERERTGEGQFLPVTMLESALSYQWNDVFWSRAWVGDGVTEAPGELAEWFPMFQAKDGPVMMILLNNALIELLSVWRGSELHLDPRFSSIQARYKNRDAFVVAVNELIADVEVDEVCETLDAFGVPVARVNSLDEVMDDPQVQHLGSIIETEHPHGGVIRLARPPVPFHGHRETAETFPRNHAPTVGQNSVEILTAVGIDPATIAELQARDEANGEILRAMLEAARAGS
ncbi:MAG: CoA transferase [Acidimicrobiales bacterium]|nr:CoA transferase [Acidimicrobiales bacterium]MDG1878265.1 CoA transferase [Acidimicrobiales bacterium]